MSGFAGMVSLDAASPDPALLKRMAAQLAFRGPDGTHIVTQPGAGFCFTFLKTGPAPQCPTQPCTLDGRTWLLGDIRLDGRSDLRLKLEQHGDGFDADPTDEELLLRAWRRWGEAVLPDLLGDYSFALWDSEARRLLCVRDLIGARPFFYAQAAGWFYFSNTLNAIRCSPAISADLDPHFIGDFLLQGSCSYLERTAFRQISRLAAGHTLRYSAAGSTVTRFAHFPIEEPLRLKREEEYVDKFRALLERAVLDRLPSGPVAIFMSGGLDSTSIAAIAVAAAKKHNRPLDLRAYTYDYNPLFDDQEGKLASLAARHLAIDIDIHSASRSRPFDGFDSLPPLPEPFHEPFRSAYIEQNRRAGKHAHVAFNGYGGDGILTGQAWPFLLDAVKKHTYAQLAKTICAYFIRFRRMPPLRGGFRGRFRRWITRRDPSPGYAGWLAPSFEKEMSLPDRWRELQAEYRSSHPWHPKAHGILDNLYLSGVVEKEEPPWSTVPLDCRAPLLDFRIQRFLLRAPPIPLTIDKQLLRLAVKGTLPEQIRCRPKTPFKGDQVALHMEKNSWAPLPLPVLPASLHQFVDCQELVRTLKTASMHFPWPDLYPVTLAYWLTGIESSQWIQ